jgi:O-antigen ligase
MLPGMEFPPHRPIKSSFDQLGSFDFDTKIVFFSVITIFINAYLCAAVALLTTVYVLTNKEKRMLLLNVPHKRWLLLFSILLFAIPPIYGNWVGLGAALAFFVIFIYYLYLCTVMNKNLFIAVIDISFIISLIYVLIALFQKVLGIAVRSPSTFQNANYYSYALELVIMMSFYRLSNARTWTHRAFIVVVILSNLLAVWTTDCRSAWPSIFGGLVVYFIMNKQTKSLLLLIGLYIAGIKLALSFPSIFPRLSSLEFAESIRTDIWLNALKGIWQHLLFGVGAMGYYHLTGGPYFHAHDILLESLCSFGLLGTFFVLMYFGATLYDMAKKFRSSPIRDIYALVFACIAVTLVHGIADVTVMWPQTGMLLALILAGGAIKVNSTASPEIQGVK